MTSFTDDATSLLWAELPAATRPSPLPNLLSRAGTDSIEFRTGDDGSLFAKFGCRHVGLYLSITGRWNVMLPDHDGEWSDLTPISARQVHAAIAAY